jgi:Holliday junction resolvase RusA-like endonuclease
MEKIVEFFIPGNTPSSKNGKQWTGKRLIWSKASQQYVKNTEKYWKEYSDTFVNESFTLAKPLKVSFKFIRKSKHKFDYVNPLQTVLDLMVRYNWISDDNADIILPVFEPYEYNKENPGVVIKTLPS